MLLQEPKQENLRSSSVSEVAVEGRNHWDFNSIKYIKLMLQCLMLCERLILDRDLNENHEAAEEREFSNFPHT